MQQKRNLQQNTLGLEQQIYTSPENVTQALLVMLETFRRSASLHCWVQNVALAKKTGVAVGQPHTVLQNLPAVIEEDTMKPQQ